MHMSRTIALVDLCVDVEVYSKDDQVGENVDSASAIEDIWIVEWNLFGGLDQSEDDDEVCSV
jgi:hypothetical protein